MQICFKWHQIQSFARWACKRDIHRRYSCKIIPKPKRQSMINQWKYMPENVMQKTSTNHWQWTPKWYQFLNHPEICFFLCKKSMRTNMYICLSQEPGAEVCRRVQGHSILFTVPAGSRRYLTSRIDPKTKPFSDQTL